MRDRWPILLVAAGLLIAGGWQAVATAGTDSSPHVLFGAGVLVGVGLTLVAQWAAMEIRGNKGEEHARS